MKVATTLLVYVKLKVTRQDDISVPPLAHSGKIFKVSTIPNSHKASNYEMYNFAHTLRHRVKLSGDRED